MLIGVDRKNQKRKKKKKKEEEEKKRKGETFKDKRPRSCLNYRLLPRPIPQRITIIMNNSLVKKRANIPLNTRFSFFQKASTNGPGADRTFPNALLPIRYLLVIKIFWRFIHPSPPSAPFRGWGDRRSPIGRPGTIRENVFIFRWIEANSGDVTRKRYLDVRENNVGYTVSLESLYLDMVFFVSRYCLFVWGVMVPFRVEFGSIGEFTWDKC